MLNVTPDQHQKLQDIAEAIKTTDYGHAWPHEYSELFRLCGRPYYAHLARAGHVGSVTDLGSRHLRSSSRSCSTVNGLYRMLSISPGSMAATTSASL